MCGPRKRARANAIVRVAAIIACGDPQNPEGGCSGDNCVNRELYVECPLDCCMGGAPDPSCTSTTEVVLEKFDKVRDRKGLEAKMASDGWITEEKQRDGSTHVDRYFISPDQSKVQVHY